MKFGELLEIIEDEPVFETGFLLVGDVSPGYVRRQLSAWVKSGKLWQLRRGLYTLAPPYQKVKPHPFLVANRMLAGSYVSLQSALGYHELIPEYVPVVTSVTTGRTSKRDTPIGRFLYLHIKEDLFFGYERVELSNRQFAFLATPAKALLDLVYLEPGGDASAYLESLRLQNLERLDLAELERVASMAGKPKLKRAAAGISEIAASAESGGRS